MSKLHTRLVLLATSLCMAGCATRDPSQQILFLEGAGHLGSGIAVEYGLRTAGYQGEFHCFSWTSCLGWGADHLLAAYRTGKAEDLAQRIIAIRQQHPEGRTVLMGLSAGSAILLSALEKLPPGVCVNDVILFQPSVSASRNLAPALAHVSGRLYSTASPSDAILAALPITADGKTDSPAGRSGFAVPAALPRAEREQYRKVVILPWLAQYRRYGWNGGHVSSTRPGFVEKVIAPRILPRQAMTTSRSRNKSTLSSK